ncbi:MAG: hypothetical protein LBK76_06600 [Verrucomicrobiales bacterium]|jgi:hypothetical protein|nr:hypothetical protein [Verrucomicrobiales bacterium]
MSDENLKGKRQNFNGLILNRLALMALFFGEIAAQFGKIDTQSAGIDIQSWEIAVQFVEKNLTSAPPCLRGE